MKSRGTARKIARVLLGVLLFAQVALAVAGCDWLRVAPAQAIGAKAGEPTCHEAPARTVNLCLAHCLGADQSTDTPQVAIPAWSQAALLVIAYVERAPTREAILQYTLPRPGAPPRIRFQSLLL